MENWGVKKKMTSASCFICGHLATCSFTFPLRLKKTAGWHVVHLRLEALGQQCADGQAVALSVWLWIRLRLDTT